MKIVVLTGRFGMGHMMAALAVKQQIELSRLEAEVEVVDWLEYASPRLADQYYAFFQLLVSKGHTLYNRRYRYLENKQTDQKPELRGFFLRCCSRLMKEKAPDFIISTLPICSQILSLYKEKTGASLPLITCVTDITGHSEWINRNTDYYFVGSRCVADKFIAKGVPPSEIFITGLPVRPGFLEELPGNADAKGSGTRHILIMGGGLGMLPKTRGFYSDLDRIPGIRVTIITGKNQALFRRLQDRYENIRVLGYVPNVHDYMRQADLIITKPGGVTTFEAIYAGVPILALKPSLQQECYNAQYIQDMGIGTVMPGKARHCLREITRNLEDCRLLSYRTNVERLRNSLIHYKMTEVLEDTLIKDSYKYHSREDYDIDETVSFNI
ncbi:UDP-N-acetylglucosamine:LPS N-acetylglucosamine transferase [Anaerotaenia torta]|uniref:MGDG synthase family glycosyltransferase n=1 Tax=Anaerotaenia torta TaxID=433293 RepID=UPI003D1B7E76